MSNFEENITPSDVDELNKIFDLVQIDYQRKSQLVKNIIPQPDIIEELRISSEIIKMIRELEDPELH